MPTAKKPARPSLGGGFKVIGQPVTIPKTKPKKPSTPGPVLKPKTPVGGFQPMPLPIRTTPRPVSPGTPKNPVSPRVPLPPKGTPKSGVPKVGDRIRKNGERDRKRGGSSRRGRRGKGRRY